MPIKNKTTDQRYRELGYTPRQIWCKPETWQRLDIQAIEISHKTKDHTYSSMIHIRAILDKAAGDGPLI